MRFLLLVLFAGCHGDPALDDLFGERPASLGRAFRGVELGANYGSFDPEALAESVKRTTGVADVTFEFGGSGLENVIVEVIYVSQTSSSVNTEDNDCAAATDKARAAWGFAINDVWFDTTRSEQASVGCFTIFAKYLEPADWIAQIPFDAIGKSAPAYFDWVPEPKMRIDTRAVHWHVAPLSHGGGNTDMSLYAEDDRTITGVAVETFCEPDVQPTIRDALTAKLGVKPDQIAPNKWRWKGRQTVELEVDGRALMRINIAK